VTLSRIGLGDLAGAAGDLAAARRYYADALPFARQYMGASPVARCLTCLAIIATRQGDLGPARAYLTESLERSMTAAHRRETVRALAAFAALARREGLTDRAVTLAAAEAALREDARLPARPHRREQYREAAGHLDDGQFERLWAAGLRLTAGEAAALATQPGARLRGVLEDE
jgi:hypothetical protein